MDVIVGSMKSKAPLFRRTLAIAVLLGLLATACGNGGTASTSSDALPADSAAEPAAPAGLSGDFPTFGGANIDLSTTQGQDVVFWFWAPW